MLFETSLPARFYLPRDDVRSGPAPRAASALQGKRGPTGRPIGGRRRDDLAWSYERPLPDAVAIAGLVAFWDEQVDVFVDGHKRSRPGGPVAEALRHEFGV